MHLLVLRTKRRFQDQYSDKRLTHRSVELVCHLIWSTVLYCYLWDVYQRISWLLYFTLCYISWTKQSNNKKHLYHICTLLDQRRKRWASVVQMVYKCFALAWKISTQIIQSPPIKCIALESFFKISTVTYRSKHDISTNVGLIFVHHLRR